MKLSILALISLLVISNAFWVYTVVDLGVTASYKDQHIHQLEETNEQLMAVVPKLTEGVTREAILGAASQYANQPHFRKDGCDWVGAIGFKFDDRDVLLSLSPSWSDDRSDLCGSSR